VNAKEYQDVLHETMIHICSSHDQLWSWRTGCLGQSAYPKLSGELQPCI